MMSTTNNWWDRMRTQSTLMTIKVESERKKESKRRDIWQKRSVIIHLVTKRPPRPPPPSLPPSFPCPHHPTHREGGGTIAAGGCRIFGDTQTLDNFKWNYVVSLTRKSTSCPTPRPLPWGGGKGGTNHVIFFDSFQSRGFTRLISDCFPQLRFI